MGAPGEKHFTITAPDDVMTETLFTCEVRGDQPVSFERFAGLLGTNCKTILIKVREE